MKVVITGGPCSGKTTLIDKLSDKGYKTRREPAREVLRKYREKGKDPEKNRHEVQREIMEKVKERDQAIRSNEKVILDVGIPEGIAYFKSSGLEVPTWLLEESKQTEYDKVILLEQIPDHVKDEVRKEGEEKAKELSEEIETIYQELGYNIEKIPFDDLEKRALMVEEIIESI